MTCDFCNDEVNPGTCTIHQHASFNLVALKPGSAVHIFNYEQGDWISCPDCESLFAHSPLGLLVDRVMERLAPPADTREVVREVLYLGYLKLQHAIHEAEVSQ
jgi:hypothetical protein